MRNPDDVSPRPGEQDERGSGQAVVVKPVSPHRLQETTMANYFLTSRRSVSRLRSAQPGKEAHMSPLTHSSAIVCLIKVQLVALIAALFPAGTSGPAAA